MNTPQVRIAVFISGSGTGLQAFIDAAKVGILSGQIVWVVSSTDKAFGLKRAEKENIETFVFVRKEYPSFEAADRDLLDKLKERRIDYIALAGYLKLLPASVVKAYHRRIVNIHPALLPKYGGKGMYGHHVHEAVLAAGDKESGATVHLVDEIYDNGLILEQVKVPVLDTDTPEILAARVLEQEHKIYPRVLEKLIKGKYKF
ncbi:MAG: phosphoribosylglycinamide formyltransferase [candidate division Zixibacteria bacterium]|nr:phosphoribosylglycinamide formyltransferase [candidate division Zixibacteria bacterium]MDD5425505.1 phosphoribosylglycinamide formyltransferase [candidate division Zixibacteria bacterium]